jgi:hypothetical protein
MPPEPRHTIVDADHATWEQLKAAAISIESIAF